MSSFNLKGWLIIVTVMITLFSMLFPQLVVQHGGWVAMLLIVLCGVPHGATDHLLFGYVRKDFNEGWMYRFASRYLLLMGLLIVGWMILPSLALMIFLAISVYHFGQSQLYYIQLPTAVRLLLYSSWGAFALFTPLLWNYPETQPIVASLTGLDLYLPSHYQLFIPIGLALFITLSTLVLFLFDRLTVADLIWENFVLLVLLFLFSATPLLVGFATYFVFWHSYDSMRDQYQQFSTYQPAYTLRTYIQQIIPFFFLALLSLVGFSWWTSAPLLSDAWIGQFFMLISIVTLPHSILMDAFLENSKANQQNVHEKTQQGGVEQVWQAQ